MKYSLDRLEVAVYRHRSDVYIFHVVGINQRIRATAAFIFTSSSCIANKDGCLDWIIMDSALQSRVKKHNIAMSEMIKFMFLVFVRREYEGKKKSTKIAGKVSWKSGDHTILRDRRAMQG